MLSDSFSVSSSVSNLDVRWRTSPYEISRAILYLLFETLAGRRAEVQPAKGMVPDTDFDSHFPGFGFLSDQL